MNYEDPNSDLGELFSKAERELDAVARKYGFQLRLTDIRIFSHSTWFFLPEVDADWQPEEEVKR